MELRRRRWLMIAALFLLVGCSDEPDDPAQEDDPDAGVEQDDDAGDDAGAADAEDDAADPVDPDDDDAAGLFITDELLDRAIDRSSSDQQPFASSYNIQAGRAESGLDFQADPFVKDDITDIEFGWCDDEEGTLSDATSRLEEQGDVIRTLAMQYALSDETEYADHAVDALVDWANEHTPVNIYDFDPDFADASIEGQTEDFCSERPWNFALDAMWQAYGLINFADAYLLLVNNDYELSQDDEEAIETLLLDLTEAVNSSFRAWTEWADANSESGSYERYRADNHLSWSLAGLLAGAAALGDDELAAYVLDGGSWEDSRGGAYENPSYIRDVIDRTIENDGDEIGRFYEEKIERDPPVGYSFFHLWALEIVAQIAAVHFDDDIWSYTGEGAGLYDAYQRYSDFVLGERDSPRPDQDGDMEGHSWHYELAYHHFGDERFRQVIEIDDRQSFIVQSFGPVALLFGE